MRARTWNLVAALLVGAAAGLGLFTFGYARGYSYLGHDPAACANCHVMSEHFAAWTKGSHHAVATCNDCHTPHALIPKYMVKARNGFWHSFYFTVGDYPDPLRITEGNRRVTENACRSCHAEITEAIDYAASGNAAPMRLATRRGHARGRTHLVHPLSPLRRPLGEMTRAHHIAHDARPTPSTS